jgi:hypothetical protein
LSGRRGHGRRRRAPAPHRCRVGGLALSAGLFRCEHCHLRGSPAFAARIVPWTDAGLSSLFGLCSCRAEKPAHSAAAAFRSTRGFCISAIKARALSLRPCAHQTCAPCDAPLRRLATPEPPAPVFGCCGHPPHRQDPGPPLPPPPLPFARSLRRLAPQTQQPPSQQQSSELLSALRGAPLERQRPLTASAPRLVCVHSAPSIR